MEKNNDWPYDMQDPFNPMTQYEQGYMYYKFLTQQMEYKIKCKEFENMNSNIGLKIDTSKLLIIIYLFLF